MGAGGTIGIMIEGTIEMTATEGTLAQVGQSVTSVESLAILPETAAKKREEPNAIAAIKKGT